MRDRNLFEKIPSDISIVVLNDESKHEVFRFSY